MSTTGDFLKQADALLAELAQLGKRYTDEQAQYADQTVTEKARHSAVLTALNETRKQQLGDVKCRLDIARDETDSINRDLQQRAVVPRHPRSRASSCVYDGEQGDPIEMLDKLSWKIQNKDHKWDKLLHRQGWAFNAELAGQYYNLLDRSAAATQEVLREEEAKAQSKTQEIQNEYCRGEQQEMQKYNRTVSAQDQNHRSAVSRWNGDVSRLMASGRLPALGQTATGCFPALAADKGSWMQYREAKAAPKELLVGIIAVPTGLQKILPEQLRCLNSTRVYNPKANCFIVPLTVSTQSPLRLLMETDAGDTMHPAEIACGWILRQLALLPKKSCQVLVADPVNRGSSLGKLSLLTGESGCGALKTALSQRDITQELEAITRRIDSICETLSKTGCKTIYEYNARCDAGKALPYTTLVLHDYPVGLDSKSLSYLDVICNKSDQCGVSVLLSHRNAEMLDGAAGDLFQKYLPAFWHVEALQGHKDKLTMGRRVVGYRPFGLNPPESFYAELNRVYREKVIIENKFSLLYPRSKPMFTGSAVSGLEIPFAVEADGTPVVFRLGFDVLSYAFITGSVGSGKTTLLHALIAGAAWTYSPSELEMWLVDFKQTEFAFYEGHCPAHVRYVAANESSEIAYSVLDELEAEMSRRRRVFSRAGVNDFASYRKSGGEMPRLLVIVDEFHRMSQAVAEDDSYKTLLENVISEYRAFGLVMILCDQMISQGLSGLSSKAKNMISVKIAMRNKPDEVRETLQIPQSALDETLRDNVTELATAMKGGLLYRQELLAKAGENGNTLRFVSCRSLYIPTKEGHSALIAAINAAAGDFRREKSFFIAVSARPFRAEDARKYLEANPLEERERWLLGSPMGLQKYFDMKMEPGIVGENLLLVGTDHSKRRSILASVIFSAVQAGRKVTLLTPKNTPFYAKNRGFFEALPCRIIESFGEMCRYIAEKAEQAELCDREDACEEQPEPELAVLLSPEELYRRMDTASLRRRDVLEKAETVQAAPAPEPKRANTGAMAGMLDDLDALLMELDAVPDAVPTSAAMPAAAAPAPEAPQPARIYNGNADLSMLLRRGPTALGLHFAVVTEKSAFLREMRQLSLLDHTNHRIALRMSPEDASCFMSKTRVMKTLSEDSNTNCAVYSNMGGREVAFRPFAETEGES